MFHCWPTQHSFPHNSSTRTMRHSLSCCCLEFQQQVTQSAYSCCQLVKVMFNCGMYKSCSSVCFFINTVGRIAGTNFKLFTRHTLLSLMLTLFFHWRGHRRHMDNGICHALLVPLILVKSRYVCIVTTNYTGNLKICCHIEKWHMYICIFNHRVVTLVAD